MELLLVLLIAGLIIYFAFRSVAKEDKPVETQPTPVQDQPKVEVAPEAPVEVAPKADVITQTLDVNKDGRVNVEDVKEAVKKVKARAKKVADVDKDGKVTKNDVKAAAKKIRNRRSKA